MKINYNATAMMANYTLNRTDNKMTASMERLSSGLKINYAKDNPAGLAISNRMHAQIRGLGVGSDNTKDGISVVETCDGALSEISSIVQRLNELCIQAGDGVKTDDDRDAIDQEVQKLKEEIERIAKDTEYNGMPLLDGSFDLKGYTNSLDVKVNYYSDNVPKGKYEIDFAGLIKDDGSVNLDNLADFPQEGLLATYDEEREELTIKASGDFEMRLKVADPNNVKIITDPETGAETTSVVIDVTHIGAMKIQIGANEGQELAIRIPKISLYDMGIDKLSAASFDDAQKGIQTTKEALSYVNATRSRLGAYQNRLEHNSTSTDISEEAMTAAYSRIMDVDMAEEMTEYTTQQVLEQAGISMLAQANERPSQILQLLQ